MSIAVFKNKTFQVSSNGVYTLNGLTWGGEIQAEAQDKLNSKPSTYIKGNGLKHMSFEIPLKTNLGMNVRNEMEDWEAIRDSLQSSIFMLGVKPLGSNKWLLKSVDISDTIINNKGILIQGTLRLDFEEFVRPGSVESSSTSSNTSSGSSNTSPGKSTTKAAVNSNVTPSDYIYKPPTKAQQTRGNVNVNAAVSSGARFKAGGVATM